MCAFACCSNGRLEICSIVWFMEFSLEKRDFKLYACDGENLDRQF